MVTNKFYTTDFFFKLTIIFSNAVTNNFPPSAIF